MKKKQQIPLKDLNLTSRFLFAEVSEDPQAHQEMQGKWRGDLTRRSRYYQALIDTQLLELREFLHYIEHTTDEVASRAKNPGIHRIHECVRKVKFSEEGKREGINKGEKLKLLEMVAKKLRKHKTPELIAEELEEPETIMRICTVAEMFAPDYDCEQIYQALYEKIETR